MITAISIFIKYPILLNEFRLLKEVYCIKRDIYTHKCMT